MLPRYRFETMLIEVSPFRIEPWTWTQVLGLKLRTRSVIEIKTKHQAAIDKVGTRKEPGFPSSIASIRYASRARRDST